jgi:mono/diheme cytochrome c family protein
MRIMIRRTFSSTAPIAALLLAACGGEKGPDAAGAEAAVEAAREAAPVSTAVSSGAVGGGEAELLVRGETLFNQVCTACHTLQPPPNLAPPMMGISGHYHDQFAERDEAVAWMVAYIQSPDPANSKLSEEAFERFGTMAPEQDPRPAWERSSDGGP